MSDLRERLMLVATDFNEWGHIRTPDQVVAALLPIIEAELQKRDKEHFDSLVKAESECLEETEQLSAKLTETNKLLEQTIEVLEGLATAIDFHFVHEDGEGEKRARELYEARQSAHALLDNLKAREP